MIIVNRHGRRFVNEGATYQDLPKSFLVFDQLGQEFPNEAPVWMVFDQRVKDTQTVLDIRPDEPAPEWMPTAPTLADLARVIGVDADGLEQTVERFNSNVAVGVDPDFKRGTMFWENFLGGGPTAESSLAPISSAPYYALPIYHGVLGTNGGLRIDEHARVLSFRGGVVEGLYAAGNTTASVFGPSYPGGGATIGPAIVFGFRAGAHAAARADGRP